MGEGLKEQLEKLWCEDAEYIEIVAGVSDPLKGPGYVNRLDNEVYAEFGCSIPVSFHTSEGIKTMQPGKSYDENLNEIPESKQCSCVNFYNQGDVVTCNCDIQEPILKPTESSQVTSNDVNPTLHTLKYDEALKREINMDLPYASDV